MPSLDGASALLEMHQINPSVRGILCSGQPPSPKEQRLIDELGAQFLQKPFTATQLVHVVRNVLDGRAVGDLAGLAGPPSTG